MRAHANPASYLLALHQSQMPLELQAFPLNLCSNVFVCVLLAMVEAKAKTN
jgi:hypothetical protein